MAMESLEDWKTGKKTEEKMTEVSLKLLITTGA